MHSSAEHNRENGSSVSDKLLLGGGLLTAGIISAPYIGSFFNVGRGYIPEVMSLCGSGSGLALHMNNFLGSIPLVGESLAAGGIATAATSGIIGIGGMLLGNYIQKKYDANSDIPWGKIIKYACLATSILISLPSILSGLSIGIGYIASFAGMQFGNSVLTTMIGSLGMTAMNGAAAGAGIGSLLTHFLTCGGAALSVAGALFLDKTPEASDYISQQNNTNNVTMELVHLSPLKRGEVCQVAFRLKDKMGNQLSEADLKETHTKKLHVMIVDNSLTDYHHIHPKYNAESGLFTADFVPNVQNSYSAWHDFTLQNGAHYVLKNKLPIAQGMVANSGHGSSLSPVIQHSNQASVDGVSISVEANPPLGAGKNSTVQIKAVDAQGMPIKLEPILGAYAHLVGFSKDGKHFLHCHPLEGDSKAGELNFHIAPPEAGLTKFFLQIKTNGREVTLPFGQYIQPPAKFSERSNIAARHEMSANMAM